MGTEKFIAFKEDGTAYRLKGRILRFLDNEPVSEADKTNIRSTLSVPASAEGLTPSNNLSDVSSAATSRTNLGVNGIAEDAQANALKTTAPALYFNGTSSVVTVADDDKLSFTDGVNDLPFTVSAWIKCDDLSTEVPIITKFGSGREFNFYVQDSDLALYLWHGTNSVHTRTTSTITGYNGQWIHVAATYSGTSGGVFSSAANGIKLFINGVAQTITATNNASYTGIANTSEALRLGARLGIFGKLHLRDAKIFNRELTAAEIAELSRGNDLGFAEEFAGANGGVYTSDFSAGVDGFSASNLTLDGNIDAIGGKDDSLRLTCDAGSLARYARKSSLLTIGKRYRLDLDTYIPSTNSECDGISVTMVGYTGSGDNILYPTLDTWSRLSFEFVATGTDLFIYARDASSGSLTFTETGGDLVYINNFRVTEIGTLADFRAERYDTNTNKLYDLSDNAFVGTGTSISLTGREVPVYETGTWTPVFIGSTTSDFTYSAQEGYYMRIGNTVFISGLVTISALGTSAGNISVGGLPFTTRNTTGQLFSASVGFASGMAGLTSIITGLFSDGDTDIDLYDWGATGVASLTEANLTGATSIRFSGAYQIQ